MQKQRIVLKLAISIFIVILLGLSIYLIIDYNKNHNLKFDNRENISRNIIVKNMRQKLDKYEKESTLDDKDNNNLDQQNKQNNESNLNNDFNPSPNTNQSVLNNNVQNNSISNNPNNNQSNYTDDNSNNNGSNKDSNVDNNSNNIINDNNSENQTNQIPVNDDINQDIDNRNDLYDTMELCTEAGFQVGFKDTEDILSTYCESVVINGKVKYKLYVICKSGNCDKYL